MGAVSAVGRSGRRRYRCPGVLHDLLEGTTTTVGPRPGDELGVPHRGTGGGRCTYTSDGDWSPPTPTGPSTCTSAARRAGRGLGGAGRARAGQPRRARGRDRDVEDARGRGGRRRGHRRGRHGGRRWGRRRTVRVAQGAASGRARRPGREPAGGRAAPRAGGQATAAAASRSPPDDRPRPTRATDDAGRGRSSDAARNRLGRGADDRAPWGTPAPGVGPPGDALMTTAAGLRTHYCGELRADARRRPGLRVRVGRAPARARRAPGLRRPARPHRASCSASSTGRSTCAASTSSASPAPCGTGPRAR